MHERTNPQRPEPGRNRRNSLAPRLALPVLLLAACAALGFGPFAAPEPPALASDPVGATTFASTVPLPVVPVAAAEGKAAEAAAGAEALAPTLDQSRISSVILTQLQARHYRTLSINDSMSERLFDSYLKFLDPMRRYFYAADIREFEKYRTTLDESLRRGDLAPAFQMFNRYLQRRIERIQGMQRALEKQLLALEFDGDDWIETDREKAPWPETAEEMEQLWSLYFKSEVLGLRLAGRTNDELKDILEKRYKNQLLRARQTNADDVFRLFMNTVTNQYDPHTEYFPPRKAENFDIEMSLSFEGIGALLQNTGEYTEISRIIPGGPAERDGKLKPGDRIVAVGQGESDEAVDIIGWRIDDVVELIRGQKGTLVRLFVLPADQPEGGKTVVLPITRDEVKLEEQEAQKSIVEIKEDETTYKIGVISLPAFYMDFEGARKDPNDFKSSSRDVQRLVTELTRLDRVDGIVLDLRDNGGGSLYEARKLTGLFVGDRPVVQIKDAGGRVGPLKAGPPSAPFYTGPLAVMVNRLSASASEILAAAIQDYGRGVIIGGRTFGKGTVQNLSAVEDGQIKLTQAKFYRITGGSTQVRGVVPDVYLPTSFDLDRVGESALDAPLPWDKIPPVKYFEQDQSIAKALPTLRRSHEERSMKDPDFVSRTEFFDYLKEVREETRVSLNEEIRKKQQEDDLAARLAIENRRRTALGLETIKSFDEADDEDDKSKDEDVDAFAKEAAHILVDSIVTKKTRRTVQR